MPKMKPPGAQRHQSPPHRSSGQAYSRLASDEGAPSPEQSLAGAGLPGAADTAACDTDLRIELRDRFHMASGGLDGRLIRSEWLQLCDELQTLLGDKLQSEPELGEQGYAFFDEKTRGRDDATLTEADFLEWWQLRSDATREHVGSVLRSERLKTKEPAGGQNLVRTNTLRQSVHGRDTAGSTSESVIGREVGAQLTEQIMELRSIRGFEEAEQVGDILWDMSKNVTTAGVSCCTRSWDWIIDVLPTLPRRFWVWLLEPVPISDEISLADWWKVFVLHLLSYCCPPLVFWSLSRKATPGVVLADTRSYAVEFLYRSYWLGASTIIPVMWYRGELPTLVKSEVWLNICMYGFLAVVNSHEEANLSKVRKHHRAAEKRNNSAAAGTLNYSEELSAYIEFIDLAAEIELHTRASSRVGTTGQRLTELESLPIRDPRFDSFDEFSFSRDYQEEITQARTGKVFTSFSVRFTELIVMLGRQVSWYSEQFESVANPDAADPFCREKKKQYMSCLIKMKQSDIARLRLVGKLEEAGRLEASLTDLNLLHRDIAACNDLLDQLEQLGHQERNIILRVLPFMCIGLFLLLYVGNFAEVLQSTIESIKGELSHNDLRISDVGDILHEWECALYCYAARLLSVFFLFTSFMMLMKWALKQLMKLLHWMLSRCCKKCDQDWIERRLQRDAAALQDKLDLQLGPFSLSPHEEARTWDRRRAFVFLNKPYDEATDEVIEAVLRDAVPTEPSADECRCCQARRRACPLDPNLPLCSECRTRRCEGVCSALKLTESLDDFLKGLQASDSRKISLFERFCTGKGRQAAILSRRVSTPRKGAELEEGNRSEHEDEESSDNLESLVDSWRLMLATYQIWCEEAIDAKYGRLSNKLRYDETIKQWKRKAPRATVPSSVVGQIIRILAEFKAERKFAAQRAVMILGALSCAAAPWIHDMLLGCDEERTCAAPTYLTANSTNGTDSIVNSTVWSPCESLHPPCLDSRGGHVFRNGSLCQVQPQTAGFDQAHACSEEGEGDQFVWWRITAAFTEFTLTYSIFSLLLRVLRGYHLRSLFMEYFSQTVPWPGIRHTEPQKYAYGLLPQFELNDAGNIVAWNKIRCFLQTFEAEEFNQEQQKISWVVLISLFMMGSKIVALANHHVEQGGLTVSILMDTLMIKIIVMQMQSIIVICNLLWTGVQTTRMQEHGLRHILLLKKSQLTMFCHPLYFSASKRVDMLVPATFTLPQLQDCIETRLGISLAQQRIAVHGISFYGNGSGSSAHDRQIYEDRRSKLIACKYRRRSKRKALQSAEQDDVLSAQETAELLWYQKYLKKDDAIQSVNTLKKLRDTLQAQQESDRPSEDTDRLRWVEKILKPYDACLVSPKPRTRLDADLGEDPDPRSFPRLHAPIEKNSASDQQSTPRSMQSECTGVKAGATVSSAAVSLTLNGPSLKALAAATATSNDDDGKALAPSALRLELQEPEGSSDYVKYKILIREGQQIVVTSDKMHPSDHKLLERWLKINSAEAEPGGLKTSASVLVIGQELHAANLPWPSTDVMETQSHSASIAQEHSDYSFTAESRSMNVQQHLDTTAAELPPIDFRQWVEIDTMRHMIDSLVAIMEEERLPVAHLETIEDTRPTIRLPFYGPYPLTTALFATVTTVLFGAVSTSVTVLVSQTQ